MVCPNSGTPNTMFSTIEVTNFHSGLKLQSSLINAGTTTHIDKNKLLLTVCRHTFKP